MIFHNFVLILECKYNQRYMQLRLKPITRKNTIISKYLGKFILFTGVILCVLFVLSKIEIPAPSKLIKHEISNDKLIVVK